MTTFAVDAVEEAAEPPPTVPLAGLVKDALWSAPGAETRVVDTQAAHPLLAAVHLAYAQHRPLVLSPDAVWLTIAQGFAQHVRLNAQAFRERLVRHEGRKTLRIQMDELPQNGEAIQRGLSMFREVLREELGQGLPRLLSCDFSTSTDIERMAGDVVLMDTFSPYFDYLWISICGIPRVTLLGTPEDWRAIRRRIDVIAEFDLAWWTSSLLPIADELVRASEGHPDPGFWKGICQPTSLCGAEVISGWIARLFPYVAGGEGRCDQRNPLLEVSHAELMARPSQDDEGRRYIGPGIRLNEAPPGRSTVPVEVEDPRRGTRATWSLEGGLLAVEVQSNGALLPRAGVIVQRGSSSMAWVAGRILAEHEATPVTPATTSSPFAELNTLYDQLSRATLFPRTNPWRIRAIDEHDMVVVPMERGFEPTLYVVIDLPDGTVLALHEGPMEDRVVRLRADLLEAMPPSAEESQHLNESAPMRPPLRFRGKGEDIPIVGSLAAVLAHALDHGGSLELRVVKTLGALFRQLRGEEPGA